MAISGRRLLYLVSLLLLPTLVCSHLLADGARFDLSGPKVEVRVTRGGKTLPIAAVPNLLPGDKIWLHPDLPTTQSVHYLLIAVFLRGTTNPPPDDWFTRIETWNKKVREEGVFISVPAEAQQAILFLAPETGGDYSTLKSAVKGRPGVFVRASQDLAEAGFEQGRIERYLAAMRQVPPSDPKALADHSALLARTLNLKPNADCFKQPVDLQYTCLTQSGNQTLLDDGHGQTLAAALANGPGSDLINQASYTQAFGAGVYSAYVGAVVDLVKLTSSLHTAQYQYIPAIAFPEDADLKLRLNTPPSFHNPKSVIVIGLPAVQAAVSPPLRPADPKFVTCLLKPAVVLPVEGAPLVFSTAFAHDMVLHLKDSDAKTDLSLFADPFQGGLTLSSAPVRRTLPEDPVSAAAAASNAPAPTTPAAAPAAPTGPPPPPIPVVPPGSVEITGTISGFWGFDPFTGPTLRLQNTPGSGWKIANTDNLITGRENHLDLASNGSACVDSVALDGSTDKTAEPKWKQADKPDHIDVTLTLKSTDPGAIHLSVKQFGDAKPAIVATESFSEPAKLTDLQLHAGDTFAVLSGVSLNQVKQLSLNNQNFLPAANSDGTSPDAGSTWLRLELPKGTPAPTFKAGNKLTASVSLKDGRTLTMPVTVSASRPTVTILNKSIAARANAPIQLANQDDLPVDQQITFSLKSEQNFPRTGQIEIVNSDESLRTSLTVADGTLVLQNPHTLLATLDPLKTFGTSAFGPLRLRPISPEGVAGDWLPLATLVRVPALRDLHCFTDATKPCTLAGSSLYLVDSIATDAEFTAPAAIPEGFVGDSVPMPHPVGPTFYIRLRDDPTAVDPVTLPILPEKASPPTGGQPSASLRTPRHPLATSATAR
jgi:hypothetical protein